MFRLKPATGEFTPTMKLKRSVTEEQKLAVGVWAIVVRSELQLVFPDSWLKCRRCGKSSSIHCTAEASRHRKLESPRPKPAEPSRHHLGITLGACRAGASFSAADQGAGVAVVRAVPCDCSETRARQRKPKALASNPLMLRTSL